MDRVHVSLSLSLSFVSLSLLPLSLSFPSLVISLSHSVSLIVIFSPFSLQPKHIQYASSQGPDVILLEIGERGDLWNQEGNKGTQGKNVMDGACVGRGFIRKRVNTYL
jgi:hypothetical protein